MVFDLKKFRSAKGLSQKELAQIIGVGQSFISQIENGKDPMPPYIADKLSEIYKVDLSLYDVQQPTQQNTPNIPTPSSLMELIASQQRTIENLSETIKNLTSKNQ